MSHRHGDAHRRPARYHPACTTIGAAPWLTIDRWAGQWAARAACAAEPRTENLAEDVLLTRYRGCGNTPVEMITVHGGGHTWPGALAYSGGGYVTQSVRATTLAWSFFENKRLAPSNGGIR